jgi:hypothetical protein
MRPKPDASIYYRQQHSIDRREFAEQKAREARELLKDKIGLNEVNRHERSPTNSQNQ